MYRCVKTDGLTSVGPGKVCSVCPSWQPAARPSPEPFGPLVAGPWKASPPCGPARPPVGAAACQCLRPLPVSEAPDQNAFTAFRKTVDI